MIPNTGCGCYCKTRCKNVTKIINSESLTKSVDLPVKLINDRIYNTLTYDFRFILI